MPLFRDPGINHTVFGNYKEGSILISLVSLALLKITRESICCIHLKGAELCLLQTLFSSPWRNLRVSQNPFWVSCCNTVYQHFLK